MIDATRRQILERLSKLSELAPDFRFGQLIANLSTMAEGPWDKTLWNIEDEKLLAAANQLAADLEQRRATVG
jgi:hypothetical protein